MNEEYNKESRKAYIKQNTEGFAHELYLLDKHKAKQDVNITIQLHEYLDCGWGLTDKEERTMIKNAIKIAKERYNLNIKN